MKSLVTPPIRQQLIVSGVGGQGVLLITRLLAEAAMMKGCRVLTSETHGMAQRGGTVVSHLKVGDFSSPLIRPQSADGLLALKPENLAQFSRFVKPGGWAVVNSPTAISGYEEISVLSVNAEATAMVAGNSKSVNLALLGAALSRKAESVPLLFCDRSDILEALRKQQADTPQLFKKFADAIDAGFAASDALP